MQVDAGADAGIPNFKHLVPTYLALHIIGGLVCLPALIATFIFSNKVTCHPTLINFCCTWVIYSISYCILLFGGKAEDPPGTLCYVQSAMSHGSSPMVAVSTLILVVQTWLTFREPTQSFGGQRWSQTTKLAFTIATPYIVFILFTVLTSVLQARDPQTVRAPTGLYCSIYGTFFGRWGVQAFCTVSLVLIVAFEAAIGVRYIQMRKQMSSVFPLANRTTSLALVVRVALFNVYSVITLGVGILLLANNFSAWPVMIQAALPLAAAVVFGTQKDVFLVWYFWKKKRRSEDRRSRESIPVFRRPDSVRTEMDSTIRCDNGPRFV